MSYRYTAEHIVYKGYQIQTYVIGNGKHKIFALPAFPHSGIFYTKLAEVYPGDYTIYTLDQPGWAGYSDNIFLDSPLNMKSYVDLAEHVANHYRLENFSVLGYSFGGAVAVRLADRLRDKVTRLVLVSPVLFRDINLLDKRYRGIKLAKKLSKDHTFWLVTEYFFRRVREHAQASLGALMLLQYRDRFSHRHPMTILRSVATLFQSDATLYLLRLQGKMPIMIVNSLDEPRFFRKQAERIRRLLGKEASYKLAGDHDAFILDMDKETAAPIVKFLTR